MLIIDHKYVGLLSNRLLRYTKVDNKTYTFRCPICGDSKKNSYKTRGYIYEKKDKMMFYCHNCLASMSFGKFLKYLDQQLWEEYTQEKFIEKNSNTAPQTPDITKVVWPKYRLESPLRFLKKISSLDPEHPAKRYVVKRKIPPQFHYKLFYAPKFKSWVNNIIPGKFKDGEDEARLIIPFLDKEGNCFGVQGRSFKPDGIRYITIMFNDDKPKIFGLDDCDFSKPVYVLEGPIDSMFIPNAIAMAGADVDFDVLPYNTTFIYDNEPRNAQIIKRMEKIIDRGYNIVIWPDNLDIKDINDMVLSGLDPMKIVRENTFKDLSAKMRIVQWKKS